MHPADPFPIREYVDEDGEERYALIGAWPAWILFDLADLEDTDEPSPEPWEAGDIIRFALENGTGVYQLIEPVAGRPGVWAMRRSATELDPESAHV